MRTILNTRLSYKDTILYNNVSTYGITDSARKLQVGQTIIANIILDNSIININLDTV